jgi:hypothetical protein
MTTDTSNIIPDIIPGKIYKISSSQTDLIYIGSTSLTLEKRMTYHRGGYNRWKKQASKITTVSSYDILDYGDAVISLIEDYPTNTQSELRAREQYWIQQYADLVVNKRRAYTGLTTVQYYQQYYQVNKEKLSARSALDYAANRESRLAYANERISCAECGYLYSRANKRHHSFSRIHNQSVLKKQTECFLKTNKV